MTDLHKQLGCFGYYGFGMGWTLAKEGPQATPYCGVCPEREACWRAHRVRVRRIAPAPAAEIDRLCNKYGGAEGVKRFVGKYGCEPYLMVMGGNIQDASNVAGGGRPEERGPVTLSWPLESLREQ